jgi:hypothetical protein
VDRKIILEPVSNAAAIDPDFLTSGPGERVSHPRCRITSAPEGDGFRDKVGAVLKHRAELQK